MGKPARLQHPVLERISFVERSGLEAEIRLPLGHLVTKRSKREVTVDILSKAVVVRYPTAPHEKRRVWIELQAEVDETSSSAKLNSDGWLVITLRKNSKGSWGNVIPGSHDGVRKHYQLRRSLPAMARQLSTDLFGMLRVVCTWAIVSAHDWLIKRPTLAVAKPDAEPCVPPKQLSSLLSLPEELLIRVLARLPLDCHRMASSTCTRIHSMLRSKTLRREREASGYAEPVLVVAGGQSGPRCSSHVSVCRLEERLTVDFGLCLPAGRKAASSACRAGSLVLLGGFLDDGLPTRSAIALSPLTRRFEPFTAMRLPRAGHACGCFSDGRLIVAGGITREFASPTCVGAVDASVEMYDQESGWTLCTPLPRSTCFAASGVVRSRRDGSEYLLVAGGEDGRDILDCCQAFDGANWTLRALLHKPTCAAAAAVYNDALYVFGGWSNRRFLLDTCHVYDFDRDTWTQGPSLGRRLAFASACVAPAGVIIVAGPTVLLVAGRRDYETVSVINCASTPARPIRVSPSQESEDSSDQKITRSNENVDALAFGFPSQAALAVLLL